MTKPKPEKVAQARGARHRSDPVTAETGDYEVIGRPCTTAGGKTANVRVKRVDSDVQMFRTWDAHERVTVKPCLAWRPATFRKRCLAIRADKLAGPSHKASIRKRKPRQTDPLRKPTAIARWCT